MKRLRRAFENAEETSTGLVQEVPVSAEEEGKIIDQIEVDQIENQIDETVNKANIAVESLLETRVFIKSLGKNVDYATNALAISHAQTLARLSGVQAPSIRSVGLEASR